METFVVVMNVVRGKDCLTTDFDNTVGGLQDQ